MERNWLQVEEIVGSTILKEIVGGSIIGTKSAKLLFIWNTFNNWLPTVNDGRKTKAASFCNFPPFSSIVFLFSDQEYGRLKESNRIFQKYVLRSSRSLKKAGRPLQRNPAAFPPPPDPTTVKFICKTFQSVEQEDKYRADKKVS